MSLNPVRLHAAVRLALVTVVSGGALALGACSDKAPVPAEQSVLATAASWPEFRDRFVEELFKIDPYFAVYQGRHEFDGRLPDWSKDGLDRQAAFLDDALQRAEAFKAGSLAPAERFERDYLAAVVRARLFWLRDAEQPLRNPAYYLNNGLDPNVYVARPYANPKVRMRAFINFARTVPAAAEHIRANLRTPMPLSFIDYGVAGFKGLADYYTGDAKAAFATVDDPEMQSEFDEAAGAASRAMAGLASWLEDNRKSATQDFALGEDRFVRMLKATEMVDVPLDELQRIGEADLKRNQDALKVACARFAPGATIPACVAKLNADKPKGGPVAGARAQLPMLRQFLVDQDIVSIPGTEQALVEESPPYNRQNSAYIDIPGPYERGLPSVYYISPPDPAWPRQVQLDYIPGEKDLLFTSVHEVWPGHFLNFLHSNRSTSRFGQLFVGYAFAEGWAHYTEEMMWEAGLGNGDPGVHIGQLSNALLRNCRFLSAIGLHARGMTQDQSRQMFVDQCFVDEGNARQQAARGTYDPAYLNYTMGKLMIRRLREDFVRDRGGRAGWKAFHDRFLSFGGPPIPLVRQQMVGGEAQAVF